MINYNYVPRYVFFLMIVALSNIILSHYEIGIFLMGTVFYILIRAFRYKYIYTSFFTIATFCLIEATQGFHIFSLLIISLFMYIFVAPRVKYLLSYSIMSDLVLLTIFYFIFFIYYSYFFGLDLVIVILFFINFILDSLLVGFML